MTHELADFQYDLTDGLIAAHPSPERTQARLLILDRSSGRIRHQFIPAIRNHLHRGDVLVVNNSRVMKARLDVKRPGGGTGELLLLNSVSENSWRAIARPASKFRKGMRLSLADGTPLAEVTDVEDTKIRIIRFTMPADVMHIMEQYGQVPLPPYIIRQRNRRQEASSREYDETRYQTVYAEENGSVAAPTAGLHFTGDLLERLEEEGIEIRRVTLHVGPGTFEPVVSQDIRGHTMHEESFSIGSQDAGAIEEARRDPDRRIIAVGTTTVRALETCYALHDKITSINAASRLFIYPGFQFRVVDALLTNFHLPESTLLMLVSAFAGLDRVMASYGEAIEREYRFYSYGDAMFIH
jgi:S-adenosylmethionine:tRNA ribosyltransferase-isomerase